MRVRKITHIFLENSISDFHVGPVKCIRRFKQIAHIFSPVQNFTSDRLLRWKLFNLTLYYLLAARVCDWERIRNCIARGLGRLAYINGGKNEIEYEQRMAERHNDE